MKASELSDDDREILAIERLTWRFSGAKEQAIRDRLGISAIQFYQRLNVLVDTEAALAHDPHTVKRVRSLRETRQRSRSARRMELEQKAFGTDR